MQVDGGPVVHEPIGGFTAFLVYVSVQITGCISSFPGMYIQTALTPDIEVLPCSVDPYGVLIVTTASSVCKLVADLQTRRLANPSLIVADQFVKPNRLLNLFVSLPYIVVAQHHPVVWMGAWQPAQDPGWESGHAVG